MKNKPGNGPKPERTDKNARQGAPGTARPNGAAGFLIAAPMSGSGKTLVGAGLMAALRARGFRVLPFKVGPDYIDPLHHLAITGHVSHNLDAWMLGEKGCRELFARRVSREADDSDKWARFLGSPDGTGLDREPHPAENAAPCRAPDRDFANRPSEHDAQARGVEPNPRNIAVVESAMGLFDGISGATNACSGAETAVWLNLPVILVMDARSTARTAAAMVRGLHNCDPNVPLSAVIFNRVSSANHAAMLREAMRDMLPGLPVLGFLPHDAALAVPERHLGLILPDGNARADEKKLTAWIEANLDMERLLETARVGRAEPEAPRRPDAPFFIKTGKKTRIAVARDEAFRFFYAENLRLLEEAGAEPVPFSPLRDADLPPGTQGLYLCGGYPELFADGLSRNRPMLEAVARFIDAGGPAYAECGGMLYLGRTLTLSGEGGTFAMAGVLPVDFAMDTRRRGLGYRTARLLADACIGPAGTVARGHEFHYSHALEDKTGASAAPPLFAAADRENASLGNTGYRIGNAAASYIHLHFGSCPGMAEYFVERCAAFQPSCKI